MCVQARRGRHATARRHSCGPLGRLHKGAASSRHARRRDVSAAAHAQHSLQSLPLLLPRSQGYQGKRIDNTSVRDEPYEFVLGSSEVGVLAGRQQLTILHCAGEQVQRDSALRAVCPARPAAKQQLTVTHIAGWVVASEPCNTRAIAWCLQAIPAFEEAVSTMKVGGVRRVEVSIQRTDTETHTP